jgi:hypothetical protein
MRPCDNECEGCAGCCENCTEATGGWCAEHWQPKCTCTKLSGGHMAGCDFSAASSRVAPQQTQWERGID